MKTKNNEEPIQFIGPIVKVISGPSCSGKSFLIGNMKWAFNSPIHLVGSRRRKGKVILSNNIRINETTDLVIFEDVSTEFIDQLVTEVMGLDQWIVGDLDSEGYSMPMPTIIVSTSTFQEEKLTPTIRRRIKVINTRVEQEENGEKLFITTSADTNELWFDRISRRLESFPKMVSRKLN